MTFLLIRNDGGVEVMRILTNSTVEAELAKWPQSRRDEISSWKEVTDSDIPKDRYFRNAWKGDLSVDMGKAREIHREKLRELRKPLLEKADAEFMQALEKGTSTTAIAARKQALRDVTADPRIAAAKTPEELKAVIPDAIKG